MADYGNRFVCLRCFAYADIRLDVNASWEMYMVTPVLSVLTAMSS
jgi:hypothetical protein